MQDSRSVENDSKKTSLNAYKIINHEGLMPVSLKMLSKCLKQQKKQIDGIDFARVVVIARLDNIQPKTNKCIISLNDNSDTLKVVKGQNE